MNEWIVTAGSVVVVLVMIGIAAALGFRTTATLDDAALRQLAANDGASLEAAAIAPNARAAFARLSGGKLMIARVMGNDVSARIVPASAARVRYRGGKLSVTFGDLGYPPLHMQLESAPPWLAALAGETA
jgi:hypothetical protein